MAHELEMIDGQAQMAYVGEVPWHGLGVKVDPNISSKEMMKASGLDWGVYKAPLKYGFGISEIEVPNQQALVRDQDGKLLSIVGSNWNPVQNSEAFDFFHDFVEAGDMQMHTAGSLKGGEIVWALAKVDNGFTLKTSNGEDTVESYLLFSNPHQYGKSIDIRFTPIRVVCNNTLTLSLGRAAENAVRLNHRQTFDPDSVKTTLGVAQEKMDKYKEAAEHLLNKRYTMDDMLEYFSKVFPSQKEDKTSRNAKHAEEYVNTQAGAELGEGSYWQLYNTATYMVDHVLGRNPDTRMQSSWYGANSIVKKKALELAVAA